MGVACTGGSTKNIASFGETRCTEGGRIMPSCVLRFCVSTWWHGVSIILLCGRSAASREIDQEVESGFGRDFEDSGEREEE